MPYTCSKCVLKPSTAVERRCGVDSYDVIKPRQIDLQSAKYTFCPGKATWFEPIVDVYQECRVALETGILPDKGSIKDQDALFVDVFPFFVQRWTDRRYARIWKDTYDLALAVTGGSNAKG